MDVSPATTSCPRARGGNRVGEASGIPPGALHWGSWYLPMNGALALEERTAGLDRTVNGRNSRPRSGSLSSR